MTVIRRWAVGLFVLSSTAMAQVHAPWPTLEQQFQADHVRADSALAELIRANQDFSLLRSDEFTTNRPNLPPWLKVLWRKSHPKGTYSADDPTGGYPHVLNEAREWLRDHQDLKSNAVMDDRWPGQDKVASVSGETRVSGAQSSSRSESDIRVNYWDPQKIIGASNNIGGSAQAQFYSLDGGATWGQTNLPIDTAGGDSFHSDPTVDWTSDGTAWSTTLGINSGVTVLRLRAYKSTDNGQTWTLDATPSGSQSDVDKQMVWVDHGDTSPCKNYQYAIWHNGNPAFMSTRNPATNIWSAPVQVSGAESTGTAIGSDVKANTMGDAFGFWPTTGNRRMLVTKSTNCGSTWGTPVQIATTFDSYDIGVPAFNSRRILIYISGGAYRTATSNLVYAAWTDLSGDTGCTAAANEPGASTASTCKTRIWFARSTDGGATWGAPVRLNHQAGLNDQFNQWLVVDDSTGTVGVMYYDTVDDPGRKKVHVYWQSSFDQGTTWSAPVRVTTAQTDETSAGADSGNQFGDYNALSGIGGHYFPSWTDRRNNASEEVWTAKITDLACTVPGAPTTPTATASAPNQIQIGWSNGSPASTSFSVLRASGTCAAHGAFSEIATGATSPYTDAAVSGGSTYAYQVVGKDVTGACSSALSTCVEATATGTCTLGPGFAGLATATNAATNDCTTQLSWSAATAQCSGPLTYDVFRSTTSGFVPGSGNRLASGISGTSYADSFGLASGTTYYYAVRANDVGNGVTDGNVVQRSVTPSGPLSISTLTETFEGAQAPGGFDLAGWSHNFIGGTVDWAWSTAQSQTPTHSWFSASQTAASDRVLVSPSFGVVATTTLSFWHTYAFEGTTTSCYDGATLEISSDGGSTWAVVPDAAFTAGGYTGTVNSSYSNPLAGKRGWCSGTIGAMTQVSLNLAAYVGQTVKLRWHAGDDSSVKATGWYVDSVTITNAGTAASCNTVLPDAMFMDGFEL